MTILYISTAGLVGFVSTSPSTTFAVMADFLQNCSKLIKFYKLQRLMQLMIIEVS